MQWPKQPQSEAATLDRRAAEKKAGRTSSGTSKRPQKFGFFNWAGDHGPFEALAVRPPIADRTADGERACAPNPCRRHGPGPLAISVKTPRSCQDCFDNLAGDVSEPEVAALGAID
jgi:hypothetical protein